MKCLCNAIAIIVAISLFSRDVLSEQVPVIKAFEVDEFNTVINPYERVDKKLSEIIADKLANIRLECHADYPVQWIYTGNGVPISNTDISFSTSLSTTERRNNVLNGQYVASIFLGPLKEYHTGKYQCSRTDYVTVVPNLYIFVPGQNLFTSTQGKTIQVNPSEESITIPCSVSDRRIKVSLFKLNGEELRKPVTKGNDAIVYDPRKGFRINIKKVENLDGRYLCTAHYNNEVRDVEYTVISGTQLDDDFGYQSDAPGNYEEFRRSEETCTGDSCNQCKTHADCPKDMNCYTDFKCRDPCSYSIRCGTAATCRVEDNRPQCYCPSGFVGDPNKECLNISRERYERQ